MFFKLKEITSVLDEHNPDEKKTTDNTFKGEAVQWVDDIKKYKHIK